MPLSAYLRRRFILRVKRRPKELVVVCGEEILYYDFRLRRMETAPLKSLRAADVCADGSKRGRKAVLTLYFERERWK